MRDKGFTLVELMVTITIVAILAAVSIPTFRTYINRSKTSEATTNLRHLYIGAATYYQLTKPGQGKGQPENWHCIISKSKTIPLKPPAATKELGDYRSDDSFYAAGFMPTEAMYFSYVIDSSGSSCNAGHPNGTSVYSFRAIGDLDGDKDYSLIELSAGLIYWQGTSGEKILKKSSMFYMEEEGE